MTYRFAAYLFTFTSCNAAYFTICSVQMGCDLRFWTTEPLSRAFYKGQNYWLMSSQGYRDKTSLELKSFGSPRIFLLVSTDMRFFWFVLLVFRIVLSCFAHCLPLQINTLLCFSSTTFFDLLSHLSQRFSKLHFMPVHIFFGCKIV